MGFAGRVGPNEEKSFKTLLFLDELRGRHSTGAAFLQGWEGKAEYSIVKDAIRGADFIEKKEFTQQLAKKNYILLGHNRFATQGAIVAENSHPFEFEKVIGAHNGSLKFGWRNAFHEGDKQQVDSAAIYSELNHSDAKTMWGKLDGAAALTWIDKTDMSLHFLRNKERPLYFTSANKGETIVWASEPWMIHVACGREGIILDKSPVEVAINTVYSFDISMKWGHKISVSREAVKPYVAPKWEPLKKSYRQYDNYYDDEGESFLKKEGISLGDDVEFTVEKINDYFDNGVPKCSIFCKTLLGTKACFYNVITDQWDDLLLEMWEKESTVFSAKLKYTTAYGLILDISTAVCVNYTLEDLKQAEDKQALEKEIKLLAATLGGTGEKLH